MKINWKLRFKNKATVMALIACTVAFIYQILGILGIAAPISEEQTTQVLGLLVNLMTAVGILIDPTTAGTSDSERAMEYKNPQ